MIRASIVGGAGYTGGELLRILDAHPEVDVVVVSSGRGAGQAVQEVHPHLRLPRSLSFRTHQKLYETDCDVVFFATPNGTAMHAAPGLLAQGRKLIDLAADFRLQDPQSWEDHYQLPHACPQLLEEAVYGLPELNRRQIRSARLVANPGCYPTATILGLLPLVESGWADPSLLVANAVSGISGAGRQASSSLMYCEMSENFRAYGIHRHRHQPEIVQALEKASGKTQDLTFTPHVAPMSRGILATLYAWTAGHSPEDVQALYVDRYADEPFVEVLGAGDLPQTKDVRGSNFCRMAVHVAPERPIIVLSVLDNLVKGAAGQAVQNMNLMFDFPETLGLGQTPLAV